MEAQTAVQVQRRKNLIYIDIYASIRKTPPDIIKTVSLFFEIELPIQLNYNDFLVQIWCN